MTTSTITLTGTDKQIAWATDLRAKMIANLTASRNAQLDKAAKYAARGTESGTKCAGMLRGQAMDIEQTLDVYAAIIEAATIIELRSGWFIDARSHTPQFLTEAIERVAQGKRP